MGGTSGHKPLEILHVQHLGVSWPTVRHHVAVFAVSTSASISTSASNVNDIVWDNVQHHADVPSNPNIFTNTCTQTHSLLV